VSDTTYRPSAALRRFLHVRDRHCGFPGCGAAVWHCDTDHNTPHAEGGCTDPENCGLFCRRHHRLKTFTDWTWQRRPDGSIEWTDPTGHTWTRDPITYQLPDPEPPPPPEPTPPPPPAPPATPPAPRRYTARDRARYYLTTGAPPDPNDPPPF